MACIYTFQKIFAKLKSYISRNAIGKLEVKIVLDQRLRQFHKKSTRLSSAVAFISWFAFIRIVLKHALSSCDGKTRCGWQFCSDIVRAVLALENCVPAIKSMIIRSQQQILENVMFILRSANISKVCLQRKGFKHK